MDIHDPEITVDLVRYGTILSIIDETQDKLLNTLKHFYFTIDTVFLSPDGFKGMWQWMDGGLKRLLEVTNEISEETNPHRFHRVVLVPHPRDMENNFIRDYYRNIVRTVIHYHLWHGVVCYVIFVSRGYYTSPRFLRLIDLGAIGNSIVFDTSNYYSKKFKGLNVVEGSLAETHMKKCVGAIRPEDLKEHIQLYYDDKTFEHGRRQEDIQWRRLKKFYYKLYGGVCPGPECARTIPYSDAALDHIIPQGASNNVLLNLRMLCGKCNRNKWKLNTGEIPFEMAYNLIPQSLATDKIREIISDKPPNWLKRFKSKPPNVFSLLGL